jgi:hypothetical protein
MPSPQMRIEFTSEAIRMSKANYYSEAITFLVAKQVITDITGELLGFLQV